MSGVSEIVTAFNPVLRAALAIRPTIVQTSSTSNVRAVVRASLPTRTGIVLRRMLRGVRGRPAFIAFFFCAIARLTLSDDFRNAYPPLLMALVRLFARRSCHCSPVSAVAASIFGALFLGSTNANRDCGLPLHFSLRRVPSSDYPSWPNLCCEPLLVQTYEAERLEPTRSWEAISYFACSLYFR